MESVDGLTTVPKDLFNNMLQQAEDAKNRGQHQVREERGRRPSLYLAAAPEPWGVPQTPQAPVQPRSPVAAAPGAVLTTPVAADLRRGRPSLTISTPTAQ